MAIRKIVARSIGVDVIVAEDIAANAITAAEISSGAVTTAKLATDLVVTHGLGSVSTPSITFTGDTNTGIFSPTADTIAFAEGGVESMRIDSTGKVGIGTTTMTNKLNVAGAIQSSSTLVDIGINTVALSQESGYSRLAAFGPNTSTGGTLYLYSISSNGSVQNGMVVNSGGNVGIATTSPASGLEIYRATSTTGSLTDASIMLSTTATTGRKVSIGFGLGGGVANTCAANIGYDVISGTGAGYGDIFFSTRSVTSDTVPTERMRITSDGNVGIGTSNPDQKLVVSGNTTSAIQRIFNLNAVNTYQMSFHNSVGEVGTISTGSGSTAYNTSSDYRLKENITPMTGALAKVQALKPVTYTWKSDGVNGEGFIAHELQEIVPQAVTGVKDAMRTEKYEVSPAIPATLDEEGNELTPAVEAVMGEREVPKYQGVDTSFLVATLTAAIQEQQAIITDLKARIETLENT
jgi:hypothetical protein